MSKLYETVRVDIIYFSNTPSSYPAQSRGFVMPQVSPLTSHSPFIVSREHGIPRHASHLCHTLCHVKPQQC